MPEEDKEPPPPPPGEQVPVTRTAQIGNGFQKTTAEENPGGDSGF